MIDEIINYSIIHRGDLKRSITRQWYYNYENLSKKSSMLIIFIVLVLKIRVCKKRAKYFT